MHKATESITLTLSSDVPFENAQDTLQLAVMAAQSLHGAERVELEAPALLDAVSNSVTIGSDTDVGRTLATIFLGYIRREYGASAARVNRSSNLGQTMGANV